MEGGGGGGIEQRARAVNRTSGLVPGGDGVGDGGQVDAVVAREEGYYALLAAPDRRVFDAGKRWRGVEGHGADGADGLKLAQGGRLGEEVYLVQMRLLPVVGCCREGDGAEIGRRGRGEGAEAGGGVIYKRAVAKAGAWRRQHIGEHAQRDRHVTGRPAVGLEGETPRVVSGRGIAGHGDAHEELARRAGGEGEGLERRGIVVRHETGLCAGQVLPLGEHEVGAGLGVGAHEIVIVQQQLGHQHRTPVIGDLGEPGVAGLVPDLDEADVHDARGQGLVAGDKVGDLDRE